MHELTFASTALMICVAAGAYLAGCCNGAIITSFLFYKDDIRKYGSHNAGLTNFYRTFGGPLTLVVILCDVLKAVAAIRFGVWMANGYAPAFLGGLWEPYAEYWAGLFCLLGHMFPCMFQFKGGKGILSGGVVAIMIDWRIAVVVWGGFLILTALTRYVSLGSLWAGASFPFISWYCYPQTPIIVLAFCLGGLIVWKHRANIRRLLAGNENKLSFHRKKT